MNRSSYRLHSSRCERAEGCIARLRSNVALQLTADIKVCGRSLRSLAACYYGSAAAELWR